MQIIKLNICAAFIFFAYVCKAQTFAGVNAGISSNFLNTNVSNRLSTTIAARQGYSIELSYGQQISHLVYIKTSPNVSQKKYAVNRTDSLDGIFTQYNNSYLQLPVKIGISYGHRIQVFVETGGYLGYWLSSNVRGMIPDIFSATGSKKVQTFSLVPFDQKYQFNNQRDNRLELGWVLGGGMKYNIFYNYAIIISCNYYQSLSDQQKKYMLSQVPQYNQTFLFSAGCQFFIK